MDNKFLGRYYNVQSSSKSVILILKKYVKNFRCSIHIVKGRKSILILFDQYRIFQLQHIATLSKCDNVRDEWSLWSQENS